jgi:hypothetical protein
MPCDYVIDKKQKLVISSGWGVVTGAESLDHQNRLLADKDFNPEFCQLLDLTMVIKWQISADMVRVMARRNIFLPQSRRAFLLGDDQLVYVGIVRMFQSFRDIFGDLEQMRTFEDREEAMEWLLHSKS